MDELITDQLTVVYNGGCRAKDVSNFLLDLLSLYVEMDVRLHTFDLKA